MQRAPVPGASVTATAYLVCAVAVCALGLVGRPELRLPLVYPSIAALLSCAALTLVAQRMGWNWVYEVALAGSGLTAVYGQYRAPEYGAIDSQLFNLLPVTVAAYFRSGWSLLLALTIAGGGRALALLSPAQSPNEELFAVVNSVILTTVYGLNGLIVRRLSLAQRATEARLTREAELDPLTQLMNRRGLERWLTEHDRPAGVVMIDLDHFKAINDTHGHQAGDDLLVELGRTLTAAVGPGDVVIRLGGEEFVCLLPARSCDETCRLTAEFARLVHQRTGMTASYGVTWWDGHEHIDRTLARADRALYAAKQSGRNQTQVDCGAGPSLYLEHASSAAGPDVTEPCDGA